MKSSKLKRKGVKIKPVSVEKQAFNDEFEAVRPLVFERDNGVCRVCMTARGVQVHHIRPRSVGGKNGLDNLLLVCVRCHTERIHGNPLWATEQGFLIGGN